MIETQQPVVIQEYVLRPEECIFLMEFFENNIQDFARKNVSPGFSFRTIRYADINQEKNSQCDRAKKLLNTARHTACSILKSRFNIQEIYPEFSEIVKWPTHCSQDAHKDTARKTTTYASILYLNDNFEGGETFFSDFDLEITPKTGMLVGFCGSRVLHGVRKVTKGTRYTAPCWFTDQAKYAEL